jgi:hypothetical protein
MYLINLFDRDLKWLLAYIAIDHLMINTSLKEGNADLLWSVREVEKDDRQLTSVGTVTAIGNDALLWT